MLFFLVVLTLVFLERQMEGYFHYGADIGFLEPSKSMVLVLMVLTMVFLNKVNAWFLS